MAGKSRTPEQVVARSATRAHGGATRAEPVAGGLTNHQIDGRLASGALIPVHRGVYRVGHSAPNTDASYLAAVKA